MIVLLIIGVLLLLAVLYLLILRGRTGHPGLEQLQGFGYAHRGLHGNGVPENSMAAFRAALEKGYGIELDVHLLKDGNLAVIHDASLKRTAGVDLRIEDLTTEELKNYRLEGTEERIPEFREVLELYAGKAPIIIELKAERGNYAALSQKVCQMMDSYRGPFCIESFDPRCILWLRKNRPEILRGQLSANFVADRKSKVPMIFKMVVAWQLLNFLLLPDFVSYKFADRNNLGMRLVRKFWKVQGVSWTICSQADYDTALEEGWLPIFESFTP